MNNPGKISLMLTALLIVGGFLLYKAYWIGQGKYTYTIKTFDKFVPIPNIYDNFTAFATPLDDGQIKVTWNHIGADPNAPYWLAVGTIDPGPSQPYYVLEYEGRLYLEKDEHITPLIHALCALSRGGPENNHPKEVDKSIECLPEDKEAMLDLIALFKKRAPTPQSPTP